MELWATKVITLVLIFLLTIIFGLLPLKFVAYLRRKEEQSSSYQRIENVQRSIKAKTILSYLNCFSGGVFLGTCLLHLFPEVVEKYADVREKADLKLDFPLSDLIIACGFFLIMLIEHGAMTLHESHQQKHNLEQSNERTSIHSSLGRNPDYGTGSHAEVNIRDPNRIEPIAERIAEGPGACNSFISSYNSNYECNDEAPHHHHPGQTHEETVQIHAIRSLMLLIALSLHTMFEGLALGLESSSKQVWTLFAALAVHKSIISLSLGLQLADTFQQTSRMVLYTVIYSLVCPIGVGIGTGISSLSTPSLGFEAVSMSLQGLATGTFLYVTFFEVLQKELGVEEHSIKKVLIIILGFGVMAVANLLED